MKRRILTTTGRLLVALVALVMTAVTSATAGDIRHTLTLDPTAITFDAVTAPDGTPYVMVNAPDASYFAEPGEPMIPMKCVNFLVPTYTNNFTVKIDGKTEGRPQHLSCPIYPMQETPTDNYNELISFTAPLLYIPGTTNYERALVVNDRFVNGSSHIVTIGVPLVSVSHSTSAFTPLQSISICLSYEDCDVNDMIVQPVFGPSSDFDVDLAQIAENCSMYTSANADMNTSRNYFDMYYYILTPADFKDSIEELAALKRQRGYSVVIKTVEEIISDSSYDSFDDGSVCETAFDKESKIRNWLKCEYSKVGRFHLLIIGDATTSAPNRKIRIKKSNAEHPEYEWFDGANWFSTDSYFSDLNTKYNLDKQSNGYYSTVLSSSIGYSPTLPTGRLLVNSNNQLDNYFKKLLIYQIDPGLGDTSYLDAGLSCQQYDLYRNTAYRKTLVDYIPEISNKISFTEPVGQRDFRQTTPTGKTVIDAMRNCGVISLRGHGSPGSIAVAGLHNNPDDDIQWKQDRYLKPLKNSPMLEWGFSYIENGNSFEDLNNYGKPSVIYTGACSSAPFDDIRGSICFGNIAYNVCTSYLFAGDFGGVAFIATSRDGYIIDNLATEKYFSQQINQNPSLSLAIVNSEAPSSYRQTQLMRNLIGDPDIDLWKGNVETAQVFSNASQNSFDLSWEDSDATKVVVYDGLNSRGFKFLSVTKNLKFHKSQFGITDDTDFLVSVYKENKLPWLKLFASECSLKNVTKRYFLREENLENYIDSDKYCFLLSDNGNLNLTVTRSIKTKKAFEVGNGGHVEIISYGKARLSKDTILKDGSMTIDAKETILESGFSVEKGGCLTILPH